MKNFISIIIAALLFAGSSFAQNTEQYVKPDKDFIRSGSRTVRMRKGESYQLNLKLKKDRIYYISVRGGKSLGNLQYKIKSKDADNQEIMYDNSAYEFKAYNTFYSETSTQLCLEITTEPACCLDTGKKQKEEIEFYIAYKKVKRHEKTTTPPTMLTIAAGN